MPHRYHARTTSGLTVTGRIVLNLWRILRSDMALNIYTLENVVFHVLHQRYYDGRGRWGGVDQRTLGQTCGGSRISDRTHVVFLGSRATRQRR